MVKYNRVYRVLAAAMAIAAAVFRYLPLKIRDKLPWWKPGQRSWDRAHRKTGRSIHRLATRLGGAFVKFGQIIGTRADVLPGALIEPVRGLHDQVPPRPFDELRSHVERSLGRPIEAVFDHIEVEPIAAASLAQVHRAALRGGESVVIKIQYPEAARLFPVDLGSMRRAVRVVRLLNRRLDLRPLADEIAEFVCLELDFAREAESTERVREAFTASEGVLVPRVHRELSTDRLLVLEFVDGTPVSRVEELREQGVDLRRVAEHIAAAYCAMIFEHGFFQGDPHPGNLLVRGGGESIALLDFGLAKELPDGFADGAASMIVKAMSGDIDGALVAAEAIGFRADGKREAFSDLIRLLMGRHEDVAGGPLAVLQASSIKEAPPHFALIARAFILLNGVSHMLVPGQRVIPVAVAQALGRRIADRGASAAG